MLSRITRRNFPFTDNQKLRYRVQLIIEDPFHQEKIADYEVVEFQALKFHPALSSLVQAKE
jgi:hypothetical protein